MGAVDNTNAYYQIKQPWGLNVGSIGGGTPAFKVQLTGGNNEGFMNVKDDHRPTFGPVDTTYTYGINKHSKHEHTYWG